MSTPELTTSPVEMLTAEPPAQSGKWRFLSAFGSTFLTIFLAELGDKTQIATLLMSAQSHRPWIVFTGAATALVATSLVGVLIGRWLCQNVAPRNLEKATGGILLVVATLLILDVVGM
jgi:putative Ca2+/H+ antiporter (TMEM165/GDT1 family)